MEYIILFVDCFSKFSILVPSEDHTTVTICDALLQHVISYFGTPRRILSHRGSEFTSLIWTQLLPVLGIQQVLTSPCHPEGNTINERSHQTINNKLHVFLQEAAATGSWVDKIPSIMLTLNSMPHEPRRYSASRIATGHENLLPSDLFTDASPSASVDTVEAVTSPLHESRLLGIHDPYPNQPPRVTPRQTVVKENHDPLPRNNQQTVPRNNQTVPRNNQTVPRNNQVVNHSDARRQTPLDNIPSSSWYNSNLSHSSIPNPRSSVCNPVPRTNLQSNKETIQVREQVVSSSLPPKRKRDRKHRRERRAREREERSKTFIHDARWASQRPGDPSSSSVPAQVTQSGLQDSDPISAMRPAVYQPPESVGNSLANDNSPFQTSK